MSVPADQVLADALTPNELKAQIPAAPVLRTATPAIQPVAAKPSAAAPTNIDPFQANILNAQIAEFNAAKERATKAEEQTSTLEDLKKKAQTQVESAQAVDQATLKEYLDDLKQIRAKSQTLIQPEFKDNFQKTTPWLMIAMALGGKAARLNGGAMLQGMTGMLQGQAQYNNDMYTRGLNQYNSAKEALKEEAETAKAVRDAALEWNKGKVDAAASALQAVQQAIGAKDAIVGAPAQHLDKLMESYDKILKSSEKTLELAETHRANLEKERLARDKVKKVTEAAAMKNQTRIFDYAVNDVKQKWDALEKAIEKDADLKRSIDAGSITSTDLIQRLNRVASKEVAEFEKSVNRVTAPYLRVVMSGMSASAIRAGGVKLSEKEMASLPDLSRGFNAAKAGVDGLLELAKVYKDAAETSEQDISKLDSEQPAPASKPMPNPAKLKAYADKIFDGDVDAAREFLKLQGYK